MSSQCRVGLRLRTLICKDSFGTSESSRRLIYLFPTRCCLRLSPIISQSCLFSSSPRGVFQLLLPQCHGGTRSIQHIRRSMRCGRLKQMSSPLPPPPPPPSVTQTVLTERLLPAGRDKNLLPSGASGCIPAEESWARRAGFATSIFIRSMCMLTTCYRRMAYSSNIEK